MDGEEEGLWQPRRHRLRSPFKGEPAQGLPRADRLWLSTAILPKCQTPLRGDLALDVASHWASQTFSETHCSQGSSRPILPPSPSPSWMSDRFISWLKGSPCLLQSPLPFLFQQVFPLKSLSLLLLFCCLFPRRPTLTAGKCPSQEKCILSLKGYFDSKHRSMIFYSQLKIPKSAKMPKLIWPSMRLFAIYSYSTWVIHFITELLRCLVLGCCPNFWGCDIIYNTCIILTLWNLRKKTWIMKNIWLQIFNKRLYTCAIQKLKSKQSNWSLKEAPNEYLPVFMHLLGPLSLNLHALPIAYGRNDSVPALIVSLKRA